MTAPQAPLAPPSSPAAGEFATEGRRCAFRQSPDKRLPSYGRRRGLLGVSNGNKTSMRPPQQLATTAPVLRAEWHLIPLRSGSNRVGIQPCIGDGFNLKNSGATAFDRRARGERGFALHVQGQLPNVALSKRPWRLRDQVQSGYSNSRGDGFGPRNKRLASGRTAGPRHAAAARASAFCRRTPLASFSIENSSIHAKPRLHPRMSSCRGARDPDRITVTRPRRVPKILVLLLVWRFEAPMCGRWSGRSRLQSTRKPGTRRQL